MGARLAVVGTVLVALTGLGTLSACSDDKPDQAAFVEAEKQAAEAGLPKGDEQTYLTALTAVDAKLTADKKAALDNGYNLCTDFTNGMTASETVIDAIDMFQVDAKKGQKIVAIAKTNLCKPSASKGS